jgi:N-methylhydantoinase A
MDAWSELRTRFDAAHEQAFGYSAPEVDVELLNLRLTLIAPVDRPPLLTLEERAGSVEPREEREIFSLAAERGIRTRVFRREDLRAGDAIVGPAALEEASTTTIIEPGDRLGVDEHGFLQVEIDA